MFDPKGPGDPGDEIEGLECAAIEETRVLLILGERGGSPAYTHGKLRWATLDLAKQSITWSDIGKRRQNR